ncbi:hypothetical protein NDU88_005418 [Pleurodeles waltl]|uniref:Uncharacterized protein n=1 Tax=Pleurodeles waltl TaxID=8319 RepID=A0AAV7PI16_PLEWA|nr:hypothetical protein NDU88_005418 [Pleurodeles waltl]
MPAQKRAQQAGLLSKPDPEGTATTNKRTLQPRASDPPALAAGAASRILRGGVHTSPAPPTTTQGTPGTDKGPRGPNSSVAPRQDRVGATSTSASSDPGKGFPRCSSPPTILPIQEIVSPSPGEPQDHGRISPKTGAH